MRPAWQEAVTGLRACCVSPEGLTMSRLFCALVALAILSAIPATSSLGAVSLSYSDGDAAPTIGTAAAGSTFVVSVILGESATADEVTSLDYQPQISANGSGLFKIVSRSSVTANFAPYLSDASPTVAPATLAPTNGGVDYGGDRDTSIPGLKGINTYTVATYTFQALATTPTGVYSLGFRAAGSQYGAGGPNFTATSFASLGTYTITVPEPAAGLAAATVGVIGLRRRPSAR